MPGGVFCFASNLIPKRTYNEFPKELFFFDGKNPAGFRRLERLDIVREGLRKREAVRSSLTFMNGGTLWQLTV